MEHGLFRSAGIVNHHQHGSAYPARQCQIVVDSQRLAMPRSTMWSMKVAGTFRAKLASRSGSVAGAVLMIFSLAAAHEINSLFGRQMLRLMQ
jgi:hypothetical protein